MTDKQLEALTKQIERLNDNIEKLLNSGSLNPIVVHHHQMPQPQIGVPLATWEKWDNTGSPPRNW